MTRQTEEKQERIVEAVRQGCEDTASIVDFVHENGYALTEGTLERHLYKLGGLPRLKSLVDEGLTNFEVLEACLPEKNLDALKVSISTKESLRGGLHVVERDEDANDAPVYATTKVTLSLPSELYEAIRAAAHSEQKSQSQLVAELLTAALSRAPEQ